MSYNKTIWANGDIITADRLNNIENGIVSVDGAMSAVNQAVSDVNGAVSAVSDSVNTLSGEINGLEDDIGDLGARVEQVASQIGSPLVASLVAEMTDQERVYVYTGSETGYTSGNWYYWNGSAWTSGGVYNAVAVSTDTTLTVSGQAADAKKVGDELGDVRSELSDTEKIIENLYYPANDVSFWEQGGITTGGNKQAVSNRIRTIKTFDNKVTSITIVENYKAILYAYNNGVYVGCWNGSEFVTSGSIYQFSSEIDISNFSGYGYEFKLALFITGSDITPESGYDKVTFVTDDLNSKVVVLGSRVTTTEDNISEINTDITSLNSDIANNKSTIETINTIMTALQDGETETGERINFVVGTITTSDGITETDTAGRFCKTARDIYYTFDTGTKIANNNGTVRLFVYRYNIEHSYIGYITVDGIGTYYTKENEVYRFGGRYLESNNNISPDIMDIMAYNVDLAGFRAPTSSTLYKKKMVNLGDSIFGMFNPPSDISTFLETYTGAICYNCSFGGTYAIPRTGGNDRRAFDLYNIVTAFCENDYTLQDSVYNGGTLYPDTYAERLATLKSIDFSEVDTITIAIGTNDYNANHVVNNTENLYDPQTYNGALRYCLEKIWTTFPNIKIVFCTPIFRTMSENPPVYAFETENEVGETLLGYTNGMKSVGSEYNLTVIDNSTVLGINKFNRSNYFSSSDGTHPNEKGRRLIARHIAKNIF